MLNYLMTWMKCKFGEEDGQAMAEYGIIIALIAVIVIAAVALLGEEILAAFEAITDALP